MERDSAVRLSSALRILDVDDFLSATKNEPTIRNLMLAKFEEFLNDDYFTDIERQLVLIKFLKSSYSLSIISKVVDFINNKCDLKQDYESIILDWTLAYDEKIKRESLYDVDGEQLSFSIDKMLQVREERIVRDKIIEIMSRQNLIAGILDIKDGKKKD